MENPQTQHHQDVSTGPRTLLQHQTLTLLQRLLQPPLQLPPQLQQLPPQKLLRLLWQLHPLLPQPQKRLQKLLKEEEEELQPLQQQLPEEEELQLVLVLVLQLIQEEEEEEEEQQQLLQQYLSDAKDLSNATGDEEVGIGGEGTGKAKMEEGQLNSGCFGERGRREKTPGGGSGNEKTTAKNLIVSQSTLQHHLISLSGLYEVVVDQEGTPQSNSDTLPSDQALAATVDTNDGLKESRRLLFFLTGPQENPDFVFGNDEVEEVGMVGEGTGEGAMAEGELNSGSLGKRKRKEKTSGGERGNNKTAGVKIEISLEDILQHKGKSLEDAAKNLNVSRSTLQRACRDDGIHRWPPRGKNKLIDQSCPHESSTVVCQEGTPKLKSDILPSDQAWEATVDTNRVSVKARYIDDIIVKFQLSRPGKMAELEQQVKKRLKLEAETYFIKYRDRDEVNELIVIACDEDLEDYLSSSRPLGTGPVEVFLQPK